MYKFECKIVGPSIGYLYAIFLISILGSTPTGCALGSACLCLLVYVNQLWHNKLKEHEQQQKIKKIILKPFHPFDICLHFSSSFISLLLFLFYRPFFKLNTSTGLKGWDLCVPTKWLSFIGNFLSSPYVQTHTNKYTFTIFF